MEKEEWKDVDGFNGLYQVSTFGNVKSNSKQVKGKNLTPVSVGGYLRVRLCKGADFKKPFYIHRLVAMAFIPNPDNKQEVNHKNLLKNDNSVKNLEWCTPSENIKHSYNNGRKKKSGLSLRDGKKLTPEDVISIWQMRGTMEQKYIAKIFNVTPAAINRIYQRRIWKGVNPELIKR